MRANLPAGAYGGPHSSVSGWFGHLASQTAYLTGKPATFLLALLTVIVWAATGPIFHYSDTWQLVINTGTTIITFLMVFLIQNTQTRDTTALQMKLDELIMATKGASNGMVGIEDATEDEINEAKLDSRQRSQQ
jgi:low affinity Fe/Cu permease